jgi:tRNA-specific 2-thiouridylase
MKKVGEKEKQEKPKVWVAMSGGVDSSLSAYLLKKEGYQVMGVFIKGWTPPFFTCSYEEDRGDAMRVAEFIGIPFKTLDLGKEYKKLVIGEMLSEYKLGRTPNPDVLCNERVKFGLFAEQAFKSGADFIATGHYARIVVKKHTNILKNVGMFLLKGKALKRSERSGKVELLAGKDKNKDQSYFLYRVSREVLVKTIFPVGNLTKPEVRQLAKKYKLPTAKKRESQGLCFVGKLNVKDFLARYIKQKEGKVLNSKGKVIGSHPGSDLFTIGERHGFSVTEKTPNDEPYYIVAKDHKKNTLTVVQKRQERGFYTKKVIIDRIHWISETPKENKNYLARIRYREPLSAATLRKKGKNWEIIFKKPRRAVAPGQSLVLYSGQRVLGGGVIV